MKDRRRQEKVSAEMDGETEDLVIQGYKRRPADYFSEREILQAVGISAAEERVCMNNL